MAIAIVGGQGTGKSTVVKKLLDALVKSNCLAATRWAQLVGSQPRKDLDQKLVIWYDEASEREARKHLPELKVFLNGEQLANEKLNLSTKIFVNDQTTVFPIAPKERRLAVFGFKQYLDPTEAREVLDRLKYIPVESVARVLYERDLLHFQPDVVPGSEMLQLHKMEFLRVSAERKVAYWWMQCLHKGSIEGFGDQWPTGEAQVLKMMVSCFAPVRARGREVDHWQGQWVQCCPSLRFDAARGSVLLPTLDLCRREWAHSFTATPNWDFARDFQTRVRQSLASPPAVAPSPPPVRQTIR